MKIGKPADIQATEVALRHGNKAIAPATGSSRAEPVQKTPEVDAVRLSQAAKSQLAESTPVNSAKVEEVKAALREGRFQVNAHAVADKMISQAAELLEALSRKQ